MTKNGKFKERGRAFEENFALKEETHFRIQARRNKLLGEWAAEKMGLVGDAREAYARAVVVADMEEPGEEDVFRKLRGDFDAKSIACSDQEIREKMRALEGDARQQILTEVKKEEG